MSGGGAFRTFDETFFLVAKSGDKVCINYFFDFPNKFFIQAIEGHMSSRSMFSPLTNGVANYRFVDVNEPTAAATKNGELESIHRIPYEHRAEKTRFLETFGAIQVIAYRHCTPPRF
ncbi:MAG: hypothetical protein Q8L52_00345 [bacterium]|nr:hypothetical protein [bacterium]